MKHRKTQKEEIQKMVLRLKYGTEVLQKKSVWQSTLNTDHSL